MDSTTGMEDIESSVVPTDFEDYSNIFSDINTIVIEVQPNDCINEVEVETEPNDDGLFLGMSNTEEEIQEVLINYEMSDPEDECKNMIQATLNASQQRVVEVNDNTDDEMEREYISFEDEDIVKAEDITDEPTESGEEDPVEIEMRNIFEGEASSPQKSNRLNGIKVKDKQTSKAKKRPIKNNNLNKSKSTLCIAVHNLLKHKNNKNESVAKVALSSQKRKLKKKAISSETVDQAKAAPNQLSRTHVHVQDIISPKVTRSVKQIKNNVPSKLTSKHSQRIRVEVQKVVPPKKHKPENENKPVLPSHLVQKCKPKVKSEYILPDNPPYAAPETNPRSAHLKCVVCTFVCSSKRTLIQHVKSHSEDKNSFECPTCKKVFSQQCNLKRHMRCHSGERPYTCQYCKKLFADQGYLTTHLRYHTNTKPYECSVCSKTFFDRSNYIKHLKSHSGEKPYPCQLCGKSFLQQSDLTRHSRVHSGERPFKCTYCERSFTQHGDLTTHLRHHTGERPFVCSNCQKTFANKRYLNSHVKGQICMKVVGARGKGNLGSVVKVETNL